MSERHLPDCMAPDGAEPCLGYKEALDAIERLSVALKPFAKYAERIDGNPSTKSIGDLCPISLDYGRINDGNFASIGDCRRAREALLSVRGLK